MITESNPRLVSNKVRIENPQIYLKVVKITHFSLPFYESFSYFITSKGCAKRTTIDQFLESLNDSSFMLQRQRLSSVGWALRNVKDLSFSGAVGFNQFMTDK